MNSRNFINFWSNLCLCFCFFQATEANAADPPSSKPCHLVTVAGDLDQATTPVREVADVYDGSPMALARSAKAIATAMKGKPATQSENVLKSNPHLSYLMSHSIGNDAIPVIVRRTGARDGYTILVRVRLPHQKNPISDFLDGMDSLSVKDKLEFEWLPKNVHLVTGTKIEIYVLKRPSNSLAGGIMRANSEGLDTLRMISSDLTDEEKDFENAFYSAKLNAHSVIHGTSYDDYGGHELEIGAKFVLDAGGPIPEGPLTKFLSTLTQNLHDSAEIREKRVEFFTALNQDLAARERNQFEQMDQFAFLGGLVVRDPEFQQSPQRYLQKWRAAADIIRKRSEDYSTAEAAAIRSSLKGWEKALKYLEALEGQGKLTQLAERAKAVRLQPREARPVLSDYMKGAQVIPLKKR